MCYLVSFYYGTHYGTDHAEIPLATIRHSKIPNNVLYVTVSNEHQELVVVYGLRSDTFTCYLGEIHQDARKNVWMAGKDTYGKNWKTCFACPEENVFICNLETIIGSLVFMNKYKKLSFWRLNKAIRKYVMKRGGSSI